MAKSLYPSRPPEYAMRRLISVEMKLASMTGVPKTLSVTGVLLGWDVKRLFCMRWRSKNTVKHCIGFFLLCVGADLEKQWHGQHQGWTQWTCSFLPNRSLLHRGSLALWAIS